MRREENKRRKENERRKESEKRNQMFRDEKLEEINIE